MEECVAELRRRIAAAKAAGGTVYVDAAFSGDAALGDAELSARCAGWRRVHDFYPGATLCGDKFDARMPRQGRVANCYYVSSVAMVASRGDFLPNVFINKKENPYGIYGVRLWHGGKWVVIWVR